jgi:hypothetical protein
LTFGEDPKVMTPASCPGIPNSFLTKEQSYSNSQVLCFILSFCAQLGILEG